MHIFEYIKLIENILVMVIILILNIFNYHYESIIFLIYFVNICTGS